MTRPGSSVRLLGALAAASLITVLLAVALVRARTELRPVRSTTVELDEPAEAPTANETSGGLNDR